MVARQRRLLHWSTVFRIVRSNPAMPSALADDTFAAYFKGDPPFRNLKSTRGHSRWIHPCGDTAVRVVP